VPNGPSLDFTPHYANLTGVVLYCEVYLLLSSVCSIDGDFFSNLIVENLL
jgi:hypothetical protein